MKKITICQSQSYKLVVNNSFLLNAILVHCGIAEARHKEIYQVLADYNAKLIKSLDASNDNRLKWLKDHMPADLDEKCVERLLGMLLKRADLVDANKFFSDLKNLVKSEQKVLA